MKRCLAIAAILLAGLAQAYDSAWTHVATVTLDAAYIDEAPVVVPVFLSGFDSTWWANVQADGDDIRVTEDDDSTERDYYLVSIDTGTPEGCIIVNVDGYASASVNKDLRVFVGNSGASAASTTATYTGTGYVHVVFPGESTNDATTGGRNLTAVNTPGTAAVSALEFDAATYNGTTQYHYTSTSPITNWPVFIESIAYLDNLTQTGMFAAVANTSSSNNQAYLFAESTGDKARFSIKGDSTTTNNNDTSTTHSATTWYYWAGGYAAGTGYVYRDGANAASSLNTVAAPTGLNTMSIGIRRDNSIDSYLDGNIAYTAISDELRSANYVATMYDAWFTAGFRTYGATEATGGGATGHPWFYWRYRA